MPVEFLTQAQKERHGRFIDEPSPEQLARHFHFDDIDHTLIARKRGAHNRLGFAIQLGTVRHLGAFLLDPIDVPRPVITYVGRQLHLDSSTSLLRYLERKQTRHAHCAEIRKVYGYHDFSDPAWRFRLSHWLYARTWLNYFAVPASLRYLRRFVMRLKRIWHNILRRRSQKDRFSWVRLSRLTEKYWPKLEIRHPRPGQRVAVNSTRGRSLVP